LRKINIILALLFLFVPEIVVSAPSPTAASISGGVLTIAGTAFGSKTLGAPLRYDDFEDGTLGTRIPSAQDTGGWYTEVSGFPYYSNTVQRVSGTQSARQEYITDEGCGIMLDNAKTTGGIPDGTTELYVSGWFWMETWDNDSRNVKIINMGTGDGWQTRIDTYPDSDTGHMYAHISSTCADTATYDHDYAATPAAVLKPDQSWHRIETYLKIGSSGYRDLYIDGVKIAEISGTFGGSSCDIGYLYIGHYFAIDTYTPSPKGRRYWDELYVDVTRARVEISDSPTWGGATHKEIQIPTAWASSEITATLNRGSLTGDIYAYVIDSDGLVNSDGIAVTDASVIGLGTVLLGVQQ